MLTELDEKSGGLGTNEVHDVATAKFQQQRAPHLVVGRVSPSSSYKLQQDNGGTAGATEPHEHAAHNLQPRITARCQMLALAVAGTSGGRLSIGDSIVTG